MNIKNILSYIIALCLPTIANAQLMEDNVPTIVSKTPVVAEQQIKAKLFELPEQDGNYYFRANLPGDNFMIISFKKISYWPEKGTLKEITGIAADITSKVQDSFNNAQLTKRIDIHQPIGKEPLTVRLQQHNDGSKLVVIDGISQNPLKIGMDTINVLRSFAERRKRIPPSPGNRSRIQYGPVETMQVQYTYIVKDIGEINKIAGDEVMIAQIENALDSIVGRKQKQWNIDDAWFHAMSVAYETDPGSDKKIKLHMTRRFVKDAFDFQMALGAGFIGSNISPSAALGLSFKWPDRNRDATYRFAMLSVNSIAFFEKFPDKKIATYAATFINIETGYTFGDKKTLFPLYKYSAGIGTKLAADEIYEPFKDNIYRIFINYSLSKAMTLTTEAYFFSNPSGVTYSNAQMLAGLTLTLRIL